MDRLNLIHKIFVLAVISLFAINQAMLIRIQQNMSEALPALSVKNEVIKQGTGENAQVVVRLQNDQTVEGYISQISDDSFTVTNQETRQETRIAYNMVEEVKKNHDLPVVKFALALAETAEMFGCLLKTAFADPKNI